MNDDGGGGVKDDEDDGDDDNNGNGDDSDDKEGLMSVWTSQEGETSTTEQRESLVFTLWKSFGSKSGLSVG